jgi:hypothetical protein
MAFLKPTSAGQFEASDQVDRSSVTDLPDGIEVAGPQGD